MKLRIDQKTLAEAARQAFRRLPTNPTMPVLAGLLLETGDDSVTLSGFDLETRTRATLAVDVLEPGAALLSGRLLADIAAAMPAGPVDVVADDREVTVTAPETTFTLPAMNRGDYPALPEPPGATGAVDTALFTDAVSHAAQVAMPPKEAVGSRAHFGGVHVSAQGTQLVVEASDGYRITRHRIDWQPDTDNATGEILLPAADFAVTAKQMAGDSIRLGFPTGNGGVTALSTDTLTVTGRTIASEYANLANHFPDPAQAVGWARFDTDHLVAAVKRAALVNDNDAKAIQLRFGTGQVTVRGGHDGPHSSSRIECETADLDGFEIAFRPGFLASLLTPIRGNTQVWFTAPKKPVLIRPVDDAGATDDAYTAVCMPVRL